MAQIARPRLRSLALLALLLVLLVFVSPRYLGGNGPIFVLAIALQVTLAVLMAASVAFIVGYFFRLGWEAAARREQSHP